MYLYDNNFLKNHGSNMQPKDVRLAEFRQRGILIFCSNIQRFVKKLNQYKTRQEVRNINGSEYKKIIKLNQRA